MSPSLPYLAAIGLAAALLLVLFARPRTVRTAEGKVLAVLAFFVAPALAVSGGVSEHLERSRSTGYCLSCHVMSEYGRDMRAAASASLPAEHYQNHQIPPEQSCFSCHTDYGYSGSRSAQLRGVKHVLTTYFGTVPDSIRMARRYRVDQCLRCHLGARSFEEAEAHRSGPFTMEEIKTGRASCTRSGCHGVVHRGAILAPAGFSGAAADPDGAALLAPDGPMRGAPADSAEPPSAAAPTPLVAPIAKLEAMKVSAPAPKATKKASARRATTKTKRRSQ